MGLHSGERNWRDPGYKSGWDPISPREMMLIKRSTCDCKWADVSKTKGEQGRPDGDEGCERCWGTGTVLRLKTPIELLAEQID